jgi:phosphoribosylformylglycinamidine synthase
VVAYFSGEEKRAPTMTELRVLDTYWSDHCRHTTFSTGLVGLEVPSTGNPGVQRALAAFWELRAALGDNSETLPTLMELATIYARGMRFRGELRDQDLSEEINAATLSIEIERTDGVREPWKLLFKNETHNHPTEIEPVGGAETCLGGAIRDPLSGRAYVYQGMRVTGSADPRRPLAETRPGKLPQRLITTRAARGFSSYGNQIGIATGQVAEYYHPGYEAKRLEAGAVIGAVPASHLQRRTPEPGDRVLLIGGRTGRDGCGGATGSSKAHDQRSLSEAAPEVQKGNPPVERALQRLFRRPEFAREVGRCNDFGAGGVSVAVGEIAKSLDIDLDAVPLKYTGLEGTEIAISESQERMACVVSAESVQKVIALAAEENLEATPIATVTDGGRVRMRWRGETILDLARAFIETNGALRRAQVTLPAPPADPLRLETMPGVPGVGSSRAHPRGSSEAPSQGRGRELSGGGEREAPGLEGSDGEEGEAPGRLLHILGSLARCDRRGLVEQFDSSIGAWSHLAPYGGRTQRTPSQVMASELPLSAFGRFDVAGEGPPKGAVRSRTLSLMSHGFDPEIGAASPFHGGYYAVVESVARLVAAGARRREIRLSLQEYFPRPGTDPERWGVPAAALLGALDAQAALETPAIGGKDSMSGSFEELDVPPTLISFGVATIREDELITPELKPVASRLYILSPEVERDGTFGVEALRRAYATVRELSERGVLLAAGTLSAGGVIPALTIAAFGNDLSLSFSTTKESRWWAYRFRSLPGALYLQLPEEARAPELPEGLLNEVGRAHPSGAFGPGTTGSGATEPTISLSGDELSLKEAFDAWSAPLSQIFPVDSGYREPRSSTGLAESAPYDPGSEHPGPSGAHPGSGVAEGVSPPASSPATPRVCMPLFPGSNCEFDLAAAFSRAGALIETPIFRNREIEESVKELRRILDGSQILMFPGGFSAGDEPDGSGKFIAAVFRNPRLREGVEALLHRGGLVLGICNGFQALVRLGLLPGGALVTNRSGRHYSGYLETEVVSNASPWLSAVSPGERYRIPISHGEGRFVCEPHLLRTLRDGGQIATQYVEYNPNGSVAGIEGILSSDGRVFGKMGHNERARPGLYKNLPPTGDMRIFESGVAYFR